MIALKPGVKAEAAVVALREAVRTASNVVGAGGTAADVFNGYLAWATAQIRVLRGVLTNEELDRLVTTRRYWTIQGISPASYGTGLGDFVRLEIAERIDHLTEEIDRIQAEQDRWNIASTDSTFSDSLQAVVLDTVFLMHHHRSLAEFDWHSTLGTRTDTTLGIAIPIAVIRELDSLKRSNAQMTVNGKKLATRTLARQALISVGSHLAGSDTGVLRMPGWSDGPLSRLDLILLNDDLGHRPLAVTDYEIIDRATTLLPFVRDVYLITYDYSMAFTARQTGLRVVHMTEEELLT